MKKAMIKKVTAFLIAGTMLIIVVPSHNKVTAEAKVNSINYDFLNNEPGMASGKITISTPLREIINYIGLMTRANHRK